LSKTSHLPAIFGKTITALNQKIMWLKKYFYRNGIEATKKAI
jgi:hypothetical protein